jgi:hypothetical protein
MIGLLCSMTSCRGRCCLFGREKAGVFYTILGHNYMLLPPPSSFWATIVTGRKIQLTRLFF